ncbi:MAG: hypothetical protein C4518_11150 [Desulfobacteraceae bacterium]|nr:MAG: hypothetical protein C4518_11150 [Desulfobacteraceae bacterium]
MKFRSPNKSQSLRRFIRIQKGERKVVYLKNPLRVSILYQTAVATADGTVLFGQDIYGRDALLEKALF